ncbi:alpha/beta fold hydrolase [Nocardia arizonensis]|uniref:alpha/beta fold hydrolase n=1 Tax=Nocardia arizonensis TaxID=1141647 RepID=UPI0006D105EF|nr:alpha/beta hydrolase [Nocardia arizonensis]
MTSTPAAPVAENTLDVPGARLYYEIRGAGPLVVLVGAPMTSAPFAPLAHLLAADHTVLTTDPRGQPRSPLDDPDADSTPRLRGSDLAALIAHVGTGPAVVFGSSGGAVSALALAQDASDLVTAVVAHEAPLINLLDDRESLRAGTRDLIDTYCAGDVIAGWRKFFAQAGIEIPEPALTQMFGGERHPAEVAGERYWYAHEMFATVDWTPDFAALTEAPTRIVVGIGATSAGQLCDRTSRALAAALGVEPVIFPGGHGGFIEDPAGFAPRLREVIRAVSRHSNGPETRQDDV